MNTTNQRERTILASILDSPGKELPQSLKIILQTSADSFDDLRHRAIAYAIKQAMTNGHAPDIGEIGKHLASEHFSFLAEMNSDALPLALAEIEAETLLRHIKARQVTGTLEEALQVAKENPNKAGFVAKTTVAALQSLTPETQIESGPKQWPKPLSENAYIGFAGKFVRAVEDHTEADPAAILFQFLICFGNCINTSAFFQQEWTRHNAREFVLIVGRSAKSRKGTSWNIVKEIFKLADRTGSKKGLSAVLAAARALSIVSEIRRQRKMN